MSVKNVLMSARALIEKGWTKHANARDEEGLSTPAESADAVSFCVIGAVRRAAQATGSGAGVRYAALYQLRVNITPRPACDAIAMYNDDPLRTKEEVLALFDKAIQESLDE